MNKYEISMEISGPFAMWSRPDTGATPTSYPVPTWSAVKGIFESVAFFNDGKAWIRPTRVEICKPVGNVGGELNFQRYTNNYRGPLKDKKKVNFQFSSLILADVCYRIYGVVENGSGQHLKHGNNPCHALEAIFKRRLKKGQCHKTPALGWNEFVPNYWGPLRNNESLLDATEVDTEINLDLVSVLNQVFDKAVSGQYKPRFQQGEEAWIKKGNFIMLNELYAIYKGLEAAGESPVIKHNDIQSPGMGTTFRVMLDEHGQVTSAKLMTREQIQNTWSLGNGFKNHFPAVKVVYPLLAEGHADYLAWKEEVSKPGEAEYRELIERVLLQYSINLSHISCWPSYRKQVLVRKEQLAGIDDCEAVYQLFDRYSQTETGVEILEKVANLLIESALQGADVYSLKHICTLLFGDDITPKGEIKDGKRVTLMLDCFPQADIDIYASSRDRVAGLSRALFEAEAKSNKKTRNAECALTGNIEQVVSDIFPKEKLNVIGNTTLFAKNATTSGPTVKRYDTSGGASFYVSDKLSQKLAASIAFINLPKFKDQTWAKLPSTLGASPSLLLAYCKEDWELPLTPLITGITAKSEVDDFEDYLDASESVLASFKGKNLSLDTVVDFTEIIVLDKANRKINFSTTAKIRDLNLAAKQWEQACLNSPSFKLFALVHKNEKQMCSPWAISPQQIMYLSRQKYIRDGSESTSLPGISFADVMKLFLGRDNHALAKRCLQRIAEQYQPLLNYCALSRLQWVLKAKAHVKTNLKNNTQALSAVTLMAVLLFKIGRTKEIYMNDFAFQLGQLCSAMDELHIGYCKSERNGDIPVL